MNVKLLSDLHLEFTPLSIPYDGEDLLILAGDISSSFEESINLIEDYLNKSTNTQVIIVLGNHDYYYQTIQNVNENWFSYENDRVHFLQDRSVIIGNICFYGATMWTDMNNGNKEDMKKCGKYINDNKNIIDFNPIVSRTIHNSSKRKLELFLEYTVEENVVVITHHLPSYKSICPNYKDNLLNASFASTDLNDLIHHEKVKWWFHGHTHTSMDYIDEDTHVVCNPRGYTKFYKDFEKKENKHFSENLIINM